MSKFLIPFLLLAVSTFGSEEKPNILFICIDDLVPTLGCYGDQYAQTPNIDSVAAQGTTFLNHHTQWAVCGPSRAALTTGLMPEETGVMGFKPIRALLPDVITLPQHFKNEGYETACAGKFHDNRTVGTISTPDTGTTDGNVTDDLLSWSLPFDKGGTGFSLPLAPSGNKYATNYNFLNTSPTDEADYTDGKILSSGLNFLDQLSTTNKPFFLAVGFKKPHLAFIAPPPYWNLYDPLNAPVANYEQLPIHASTYIQQSLLNNNETYGYAPYNSLYPDKNSFTPTLAEKRELIHGYYSCVSFIDNLVGQLTQKLTTTADPVQPSKMMNETTVIIIWGDHGFGLGQHGKWAKHTNMENASQCPLIIFDPRSPGGGAQSSSPAQTIDIYPTLCELSGIITPTQPLDEVVTTGRPLAGRSLVPILNDSTVKATQGAITLSTESGAYGYAYRTVDFRYIEWINSSGNVTAHELYDLSRDASATKAVYRVDLNDPSEDITPSDYEPIIHSLSKALRTEVSGKNSARSWDASTDTYITSPNRLQSSLPVLPFATLTNKTLPFLCLSPIAHSSLILNWSDIAGTYKVIKNTNLSATWNTHQDNLTQSELTTPITQQREFFQAQVTENDAPHFTVDPIVLTEAHSGSQYIESISSYANDPNVGDVISYSKVDGPTWLTISTGGALSGTPTLLDACPAYFTVKVTDNHGASSIAKLHLNVTSNSAPSLTTVFPASDDAYAKLSDSSSNFGDKGTMQLRKYGSSTSARLGFCKASVSGASNISSAKLYLYSDDEADLIKAYGTTNVWDELTLTWLNKPVTGGIINSATAVPGTWFSIDVSSYVTANGTFSFILDEEGNTAGKLKTKEGGKTPYLEITHQ